MGDQKDGWQRTRESSASHLGITGLSRRSSAALKPEQINAALAEMQRSMDAAHVPAMTLEPTASDSINRSR